MRRCLAVQHARDKGLSERHACRLTGQWRTTQRYQPTQRYDEGPLTQAIIALACQYGRYGYRRITALLQLAGWFVGKDRVQRIWRNEQRSKLAVQRLRRVHLLLVATGPGLPLTRKSGSRSRLDVSGDGGPCHRIIVAA